MSNDHIQADIQQASEQIQALLAETKKVLIGQDRLMRNLLVSLLARGHILLEGAPGLAKTLAIETLGKTLGMDSMRVQCTPDLLPSDLIGTQIWSQAQEGFQTHKGPIFAHLVLLDEINRAPAKVQSALLEAMAERQVTIGDESYMLDTPFVVMATMNPMEQEGTYSLPEAQLDRFLLKTVIGYPSEEEEIQIMKRFSEAGIVSDATISETISRERIVQIQDICDEIHVSEAIYAYVKDIVINTRNPKEHGLDRLGRYIQHGASPRASLALIRCAKVLAMIQGRTFVIPEDVQDIVQDVLQHRIILSWEAKSDGVSMEDVIAEIVGSVSVV